MLSKIPFLGGPIGVIRKMAKATNAIDFVICGTKRIKPEEQYEKKIESIKKKRYYKMWLIFTNAMGTW
jgi:hypothetical protein